MKDIDTHPSIPIIDTITNFTFFYHSYEEGKLSPGVNPKDVPLFTFTMTKPTED